MSITNTLLAAGDGYTNQTLVHEQAQLSATDSVHLENRQVQLSATNSVHQTLVHEQVQLSATDSEPWGSAPGKISGHQQGA